jgi:hypothetical protein
VTEYLTTKKEKNRPTKKMEQLTIIDEKKLRLVEHIAQQGKHKNSLYKHLKIR